MSTSTEQKISNAIKWIDALKGNSGFKKTVNQLGKLVNEDLDDFEPDYSTVKDIKKEMEYCCLGVACRVLKYKNVEFSNEVQYGLPEDIGLFDEYGTFKRVIDDQPVEHIIEYENASVVGLTGLNDEIFIGDKNFKNIRNFILKNIDYIFIPAVAKGLKKHYKLK